VLKRSSGWRWWRCVPNYFSQANASPNHSTTNYGLTTSIPSVLSAHAPSLHPGCQVPRQRQLSCASVSCAGRLHRPLLHATDFEAEHSICCCPSKEGELSKAESSKSRKTPLCRPPKHASPAIDIRASTSHSSRRESHARLFFGQRLPHADWGLLSHRKIPIEKLHNRDRS
jgi:hypothetical protein